MQAVILAGGQGIRLKPFTYRVPKAMMLVNGQPFLKYQLDFIKSYGIINFLLLVGYLGKQIEDYFGDGSKFGLNIGYSYEEEALGTAGALKKAEDMLEDSFLLLYGDTYLAIDYRELTEYFYRHKKIGVLTVYDNLDKIASHNVKIDTGNNIMAYNKKDERGMNCLDAGVMLFKKDVTALIRKGKKVSLEEEICPKLIEMRELMAYPTQQRFYDMGSFQGLKLLEEKLK